MSEQVNPTTGEITISPMRWSPSIGAIADAMSKAQGEIEGAAKDSINPHFKNKYADLAAVWDACRAALSKNGIAVFQSPSAEGPRVTVTTLLAHKSGEWVIGDLTMTAQQNTPQGIGSTITYGRRYALASMAGVAPEDDDGNAASQTATGPKAVAAPKPKGYDEWLTDITAVADEGVAKLKEAWDKSRPELRSHLTTTDNAKWEALKKKAALVKVSA